MNHKTNAATMLLGRMLFGISASSPGAVDDVTPDVSVEEIAEAGPGRVETVLTLPSGDKFKVTVEWDSEASP